jgi:cyclic beta-1,2-glucan synthetase
MPRAILLTHGLMSFRSQSIPVTSHHAQLLSNGRYAVMLTAAGSGFSRWGDLAVTRWREDPTCDGWGSYVLLSDYSSGAVWSACLQPCGGDSDMHVATFAEGRAEFVRRDDTVTTTLDVAVASDRDAELRRVTIANQGDAARDIAVTSYAELVLGSAGGDAAHPAFSKLFVQTESVQDGRILLATRRRRAPGEPVVWAAHFAVVEGQESGAFEFETDRARFLGRGRTLRNALAMQDGGVLSNTAGSVLDPIFSLRQRVRVPPRASVRVTFWTLLSDSRDAALALCGPLRKLDASERALTGAAEHAAAERARFGIDPAQAERWGRLVGPLLAADVAWRSAPEVLERGRGGPPVLWTFGISGDRPIVLLRIAGESGLNRVQELLHAQLYWRSQRLGVDVVLLNCATGSGGDHLHATLDTLLKVHRTLLRMGTDDAQAEAFALRNDEISDALRDGLATAARVVLDASDDGLEQPAKRTGDTDSAPAAVSGPSLARGPRPRSTAAQAPVAPAGPLEFANGTGGFDIAAREYAITLADGRCTPMPWINVVANASFGFLVSAEGGGYTWSCNSQQNPLTPWPNDPVSDTPHEVLYLRDEDSGELWSATALPTRVPSAIYAARHGKGYSCFTHDSHEIELELLQCVPSADSIKLSRLRIRNGSTRVRRLSITAYVEWALGANGTVPAPFIVTAIDAATGALFARNAWRAEFSERVAFVDLGGVQSSLTADRTEFLGRHGAVDRPAALARPGPLSGRVGAGLDPCAALQTRVELEPAAQIDIVFALGDAHSCTQARMLVQKYRAADVDAVVREARAPWDEVLDTVQVRTPDRAMDVLLNDWLLYQSLACRVWSRTACYQSSGAYGFRDQLQDVMALCLARPEVARKHLLRAAARQFVEGDVQHWWLPPTGQGIRTRMTDDRIWLPYVAVHYIEVTADAAVLDEAIPFLEGDALKDGQTEAFSRPRVAPGEASLYEHCARALDISLSLGAHGLPLIGTGDWNDGMNRVGEKGRGESVWLAWFLLATISALVPYAQARNEGDRATRWRQWAATVRVALESAGWDGQWYRRGYYDDGAPLGSNDSDECKIDAIAQSWSVISGAADPNHAAQAMNAVEKYLIRHDDKIALLLTPPFDRSSHDPGYIKGYPPGIRENGGQYTHGTIWSIFAFAALGQGDQAGDLFAILNPIHHSSTPNAVARYKVEPYAACADVYSVAPHVGRGGWTWYTGSAGWLYRAGLEAILGFRVHGDTLAIDPCLPKAWPGYEIFFRHRGTRNTITRYEITVENPRRVSRGVVGVELDGVEIAKDVARIPLVDDGQIHRVRVELG